MVTPAFNIINSLPIWYDEKGFTISSESGTFCAEYETMYSYKEIPVMLEWLKTLNLQY